jgi:hypothetical protein
LFTRVWEFLDLQNCYILPDSNSFKLHKIVALLRDSNLSKLNYASLNPQNLPNFRTLNPTKISILLPTSKSLASHLAIFSPTPAQYSPLLTRISIWKYPLV